MRIWLSLTTQTGFYLFRRLTMPPRKARAVVQIKPSEYVLPCEWVDCTESFTSMERFIAHINTHLADYLDGMEQHIAAEQGRLGNCFMLFQRTKIFHYCTCPAGQ